MKVQANIFNWDKVLIPRIEELITERSWTMGEASELWAQGTTKPEVEVCKIISLPLNWIDLLMNKNLTPGVGLLLAIETIKC